MAYCSSSSKCYHESSRVGVWCSDCDVKWMKSKYTLAEWDGRCRSCAMKHVALDPVFKAMRSVIARKQVLAQGGIPNAVHLTSERVSGENNINWRRGRKGESHHNWKGGITPLTKTIRCSLPYKEWRSAVFVRDNYTCQMCRARGGNLHVDHHPQPFSKLFAVFLDLSISPEDFAPFWDVNNGRTLCGDCHREFGWNRSHDKRTDGTSWFEAARAVN